MKINKHLIITFFSLFFVTILIANYFLKIKIETLKNEKYILTSKRIQNETKTLISEKKNATLAIAVALSFNKTIKSKLKNNKTDLVELKELSASLKKHTDFKNVWFQIITKDGISFYRSWIKKHGDSILNARLDIQEVLKNPKIMSTISTGKFDMTFKSMAPIYENNELLGIVEVITHFNSIAKKILKKGIEPIIIVDKKYKEQLKNPFTKLFIEDYYIANLNVNKKYIDLLKSKTVEHFINFSKSYHINKESNNLITLYKLPDIHGDKMGYFILFKKLDEIDMSDIYIVKEKLFFYIFSIMILLATTFYYFANKKFIEEISSKNIEMKKLNEQLSKAIKNQIQIQEQKDKQQDILFQQSKMASMGEMIGNIAHQWRQPIAIISMWANNIIADVDMQEINLVELKKYATKINEQTSHLSQTIDDFRNFFLPNKEKQTFTLKNSIDKTINLLSASFKAHNIEVIKEIEDVEITTLENELTQALLNIIKNSKDVLVKLDTKTKKLIFIKIYTDKEYLIIEIIDNGGGVPKEIKHKIFEPYFTTKHKSQGTGIGLYMTSAIINKHLNGKIYADNITYDFNSNKYKGAKFKIVLPLDSQTLV